MSSIWLNDTELMNYVSLAYYKNMMFYDSQCTEEAFVSKRLIYLMIDGSDDKIDTFIIPTDAYPEFDPFQTLYGRDFVRDKRLNIDQSKSLIKNKEFEIWMPFRKSQIILGIYGNDCILGAV